MEIRRINNGEIFYFGNDVIPKYSFNAKELDEETGMYYYEARYYRAPTFISRDPLMNEKPWLTPYHYCSNNPIGRIDPTGMSDDWVEREVEGKKEVYYDRTVKSQADVDKKYGKNSGVRHLADGSKVGNGQYTVYNDHENNKDGVMKDAQGNVVNPDKTIIYGKDYTLFAGVTDQSVNAETLHQNRLGKTSYTGERNPKGYDNKDNYLYIPSNLSEIFSMVHDIQYDNMNAKGLNGVFGRTDNWKADMQLAISNVVSLPINRNSVDKLRSIGTAIAFGVIGTTKMCIQALKK